VVFDAFEEFGDELFAHAREFGEMAGFGGGFKGVDVANLAGRPDESDSLWAHAWKAKKFKHSGFVLLQEFFAEWKGAGGEESLDIGSHTLADARYSEELFGIVCESGELSGLLLDGLSGTAVRADSKWVGGVNLEKGCGFVEQAGDRDIVHGGAIRVRKRKRSLSQYAIGECGTQGRVTQ
jgi:hypothetical protein